MSENKIELKDLILGIIKNAQKFEGTPSFVLSSSLGSTKTIRSTARALHRRGIIVKKYFRGVSVFSPTPKTKSAFRNPNLFQEANPEKLKRMNTFIQEVESKTKDFNSVTRSDIIRILRSEYSIKVSYDTVDSMIDELKQENKLVEESFGSSILLTPL